MVAVMILVRELNHHTAGVLALVKRREQFSKTTEGGIVIARITPACDNPL
jgi:antitoxin (DNA-binding transcriptional repressor) of toxin-antitoxin stability system